MMDPRLLISRAMEAAHDRFEVPIADLLDVVHLADLPAETDGDPADGADDLLARAERLAADHLALRTRGVDHATVVRALEHRITLRALLVALDDGLHLDDVIAAGILLDRRGLASYLRARRHGGDHGPALFLGTTGRLLDLYADAMALGVTHDEFTEVHSWSYRNLDFYVILRGTGRDHAEAVALVEAHT